MMGNQLYRIIYSPDKGPDKGRYFIALFPDEHKRNAAARLLPKDGGPLSDELMKWFVLWGKNRKCVCGATGKTFKRCCLPGIEARNRARIKQRQKDMAGTGGIDDSQTAPYQGA